jgi:hypothetical protein
MVSLFRTKRSAKIPFLILVSYYGKKDIFYALFNANASLNLKDYKRFFSLSSQFLSYRNF